jgi:hypothetical protein
MISAAHATRPSSEHYSYGYYPFGPRLAAGGLLGLGGSVMAFVMLGRVSNLAFELWISALAIFAVVMYVRTMRMQSNIVVTEKGFERNFPTRQWLNVPWAFIEHVTVKRVYGRGFETGMTVYLLTLKRDASRSSNLPGKMKILGAMTRKDLFYVNFLSYLRENHIDVVDSANQP